jgi:beta-galactosidase
MIKGFRTGNQIEFFIYDGGWNSSYADVGEEFNGEWHHAAGTFDSAEFKIYVDGALATTLAYDGPGIVPNIYNVAIGTNI